MNVVIVGASGVTGIAVQKELAAHGHHLRCVDVQPPQYEMSEMLELLGYDPEPATAEWLYRDILEPGAAEEATRDMDACVYVALAFPATTGAKMDAAESTIQFRVNVIAPFLLMECGTHGKLRKFVYASTVSINPGMGKPVSEQDPPQLPWNSYTLSKWLAEEMLRQYSLQREISVFCLRLGTVHPHIRFPRWWKGYEQYFVDVRDVARAFRLAVEDSRTRFDVLHVVSMGEPLRCRPDRARQVLGFEAQYNGPEHFEALRRRSADFIARHANVASE